jgi:hypothetical protein
LTTIQSTGGLAGARLGTQQRANRQLSRCRNAVDRVESDDKTEATAHVSFLLGGRRQALVLTLRADGHAVAGLFPRWLIAGGIYPVDVSANGGRLGPRRGVPISLAEGGSPGRSGPPVSLPT